MKARIKINAWSSNSEADQWLKANAGQLIEIDTTCLFTDQYNTAGPKTESGCSGFRLYDIHLSEIVDDARQSKGKCKYCGNIIQAGNLCLNYGECPSHGINWWTEKNCFFIAHPSGLPPIPDFEPIKIGTYTLEKSYSGDTYRLANNRKTIHFKYGDRFWEQSIGYIGRRHLDIPYDVESKLILKLKELQKATV